MRQIIGAPAIKMPNKQATLFDCIKMNIMVVVVVGEGGCGEGVMVRQCSCGSGV